MSGIADKGVQMSARKLEKRQRVAFRHLSEDTYSIPEEANRSATATEMGEGRVNGHEQIAFRNVPHMCRAAAIDAYKEHCCASSCQSSAGGHRLGRRALAAGPQ